VDRIDSLVMERWRTREGRKHLLGLCCSIIERNPRILDYLQIRTRVRSKRVQSSTKFKGTYAS